MTKDNILFGIIGLLLGGIVGFIFANSVNQRGYEPRAASKTASAQNADLPPDHPQIPSNGVADADGMPPEVAQAIKQARSEPDNFDAQMTAAGLYYRIGRFDDAIEFLMRANQLRPDSYEAVVRLGDANFEAERFTVAERWYTAALVKNPDDVNVRTDLGLTFLLRSTPDFDRAIKEFRASLEREPQHEQTMQNITAAYIKKGDLKEAEAAFAKLEQAYPQNKGLSKLRSDLESMKSSPTQSAANSNKRK